MGAVENCIDSVVSNAILGFAGLTWPTTMPCTVTGTGDTFVSDTATSSSDIIHHMCFPRDRTNYCKLAYPESRAHNFYPSACMHAFSGSPLDAVSICLVLYALLSGP